MEEKVSKAVVVGGSNGIGLAMVNALITSGYHVIVLDKKEPDSKFLVDEQRVSYIYCDLLYFDDDIMQKLGNDLDVSVLMITAGFGRVADFDKLHIAEVNNILTVNSLSTIKILKIFYNRIASNEDFYTGVLGSIAGIVSSPMFSVYAASKASICRFVESVNIELEVKNFTNRILNVSPGTIDGTRFNGGENDISKTKDLANEILLRLKNREELYIPKYEETYKNVIKRYQTDSNKFGVESYKYKQDSGRVNTGRGVQIGYLSGTFDLFHIGHLNLLKKAKAQCDYLIVGVHESGAWKGKETFIPFEERVEIVKSCKYVDKVVKSCREDCDAWDLWHYHKLFVGSDYKGSERFNRYEKYFEDKDVTIIYFPYTQSTSSTQIRTAINSYK